MKTFAFLSLFLLTIFLDSANADTKLALVIGNSAYDNVNPLVNPKNDAKSMSAQLDGIGFDADLELDLSLKEFKDVLKRFEAHAQNADLVIVYYAGHGAQHGNSNYLIPTDLNPDDAAFSWAKNAIDAGDIEDDLRKQNVKTLILILDACRDDPNLTTRALTTKRGLALMAPLDDNLVAYAAAVNHTASDGTGGHGLYTGALLKNIATPNIDINDVFHRTRKDVLRISGGTQVPGEYDQLNETIVLNQINPPTSQTLVLNPIVSSRSLTQLAARASNDNIAEDVSLLSDNIPSPRKPLVVRKANVTNNDDYALFAHVLIYAPSNTQRNIAESVATDLQAADFLPFPIPPTILDTRPDTTEIRFFYYPADQKEAQKIQSIVHDRFPKLHTRISYVIDPDISSPRYYEIHFGKDADFSKE